MVELNREEWLAREQDRAQVWFVSMAIPIAILGCYCNTLVLILLRQNKRLRDSLGGLTRQIIICTATTDLIGCFIGIPNVIGNTLVGNNPPYSTNPVICAMVENGSYGMTYTSVWFSWTLALSRLIAVYSPHFYQHHADKTFVRWFVLIFPLVMGLGWEVYGPATKMTRISPEDCEFSMQAQFSSVLLLNFL